MTGLSAAYCHEISLSNPRRFVTVKDKSRKSVPRCSTRKTKKTCSDFNWKKKKDIKSFILKNHNTYRYKRLLNSERFHIYPSPTNFNDFPNGVWDIPAQNKSQDAIGTLKKFDSLPVLRFLRQIRKRDQFELFSSSKRQTRTRKQRNQSTVEGDGYSMHSVICSFGGQGNGGSITIDSRKLTERWLLLEIVAGINHDEASHLRRHFHFRKTDRHRKKHKEGRRRGSRGNGW
jgi:hypothetical protein